jgi:hypothetical protein
LFPISHRSDLSPRREFTISSAGFWIQEATDEWMLTRRPSLRDEHAWGAKGSRCSTRIAIFNRGRSGRRGRRELSKWGLGFSC